MARKSRKVAAKQAELGQRKRKASKHHTGVEASLPVARDIPYAVGRATATSNTTVAPAETAAPDTTTATLEAPRPVSAERRAPAASSRTFNPYVWPEVKRIGIITGLIVVIMGVLTVVMG